MEGEKTIIHTEKQRLAVKTARDHFRLTTYGKFDLIQGELTDDFLLNNKPRVIKQHICKRFGLRTDEINQDTFWSWLRRIRKDLHENGVFKSPGKPFTESIQNMEQHDDWKHFTPTAPLMQNEAVQPMIKLVTTTTSITH